MKNDINALLQQFLDGDLDPRDFEMICSQIRDAGQFPKILRILAEYWDYIGLKHEDPVNNPGEKMVLRFKMRKKLDKIIEENRQHFKEMTSATAKVGKNTKQ